MDDAQLVEAMARAIYQALGNHPDMWISSNKKLHCRMLATSALAVIREAGRLLEDGQVPARIRFVERVPFKIDED